MPQTCWPVDTDGRYWIDFLLGSQPVRCLVDTGLADPLHAVGFEIDAGMYDRLKAQNQFTGITRRQRRDASGGLRIAEAGDLVAQLIDPQSGQPIGPSAPTAVFRGAAGLAGRVGVVFFHRLRGCRVVWDLGNRTWCIEYP
jgi:hypothetical protein